MTPSSPAGHQRQPFPNCFCGLGLPRVVVLIARSQCLVAISVPI